MPQLAGELNREDVEQLVAIIKQHQLSGHSPDSRHAFVSKLGLRTDHIHFSGTDDTFVHRFVDQFNRVGLGVKLKGDVERMIQEKEAMALSGPIRIGDLSGDAALIYAKVENALDETKLLPDTERRAVMAAVLQKIAGDLVGGN